MKLSDHMRFPHPVLSEFSQDYATGGFNCEFVQQITPEGELKLTADISLDIKELAELIENQKAAIGYFIICRRTYFNFLQTVSIGKSEKFFDISRLFGTVIIRPAVWTLTKVQNFSCPLIHAEFGASTVLPKGSVVALGPEFRFSIDKRKFKPFESIFELAEQPGIEPGTFSVDPMRERITIFAEPKTYKDLAHVRGLELGKDLMLNAVYMPAVMEIVALLQDGETSLNSKYWYRIFKAKCDDLGVDPAGKSQTPLAIAQKLLKAPLRKTISIMESLS